MRIYGGKKSRRAVLEVSMKEIDVLMRGLHEVCMSELRKERTGKRTGRYRIASPMWDAMWKYERGIREAKENAR